MILSKTHILALVIGSFGVLNNSWAQDRFTAQEHINELCSDAYFGRGYINKGDSIAAAYLKQNFIEIGLLPGDSSYYHRFTLDVNTIPVASVSIDGEELSPGKDFVISPGSNSSSGNKELLFFSEKLLESDKAPRKIKKALRKGYLPVIGLYDKSNKKVVANINEIRKCHEKSTIAFLKENLTWSVSRKQKRGCEIWFLDSVFNKFSKDVSFVIEADFIKNYNSQNVIGYVEGTEQPDSFIFFCGHYDHLGKMGNATYYGANDNASGIAMLLDMAIYFQQHPQKYTIVFVGFAAEEAGLIGSYNYVLNPPERMPLKNTRFVFNMDLMGSGSKGATIVNGNIFKSYYDDLVQINDKEGYLPTIKSRGKAANSDHYYFSEAGIPSFFIYLMGDYTFYHIPEDNPSNLKLGPYYEKSFMLIRDFIILLNK
ncbi:MAG: M28 family peptidase [Bacteroidia bacterium]|nr:M28 family peptidase [Bacteroidia bacterium]NNJ56495.1 M28 family peptidase [Bacteroidia bacterium]